MRSDAVPFQNTCCGGLNAQMSYQRIGQDLPTTQALQSEPQASIVQSRFLPLSFKSDGCQHFLHRIHNSSRVQYIWTAGLRRLRYISELLSKKLISRYCIPNSPIEPS